jgi:hypothetical protein
LSKLSATLYVSGLDTITGDAKGDPTLLTELYAKRGYDITTSDMKNGGYIALFASATTYALLWSYIRLAIFLDPDSRQFEVFGVRLPDVQFYMSYKVTSGYRWESRKIIFPVGVEFVTKGESMVEPTLGIRKDVGDFSFQCDAVINTVIAGLGGDVLAEYRMFKNFSATLGYTLYNARTLYGRRNIPSYRDGITYNEFWAKVSLRY